MEITKTKTDLVIKVPLKTQRFNPYMDEYVGEMDNITGLIHHNKGWTDYGFAYLIDMDYKGKDDQVSDFFAKVDWSEDDFIEQCKKLGIGIYEINDLSKEEE